MAKDIAFGAEGSGFVFQDGQIRHSVVNDSPALRSFFKAVLPTGAKPERWASPLATRLGVVPRV